MDNGLFSLAARHILGRRCVGGVTVLMSDQGTLSFITSFSGKLDSSRAHEVKNSEEMNVQEAVNFRLNKLDFKEI